MKSIALQSSLQCTASARQLGATAIILPRRHARRVSARASTEQVEQITGIVFEPFTAVQSELAVVDRSSTDSSLARVNFKTDCEAAINEQINIEYNVSYVYHALYAYFDRDNVGLPGFAAYFKAASEEEREHAEILMKYQNVRGGCVRLTGISIPEMEFNHPDKGEALYAMELALALEKLNFTKLRELHDVADAAGDAQMCDFVEGSLLAEQVESVKNVAEIVSQLRRVGKGLGVYEMDKQLAAKAAA